MESQVHLRKVDEDAVLKAAPPRARLIIVANRLPVTPRRTRDGDEWRFDRSSGGLVSAFLGVKNMEISWLGWVGCTVPPEEQAQVTDRLAKQTPFPCYPVYLDAEMADHFYNGFCNNVLWPLLHYIPLSMLDSQARVIHPLRLGTRTQGRGGRGGACWLPRPQRHAQMAVLSATSGCALACGAQLTPSLPACRPMPAYLKCHPHAFSTRRLRWRNSSGSLTSRPTRRLRMQSWPFSSPTRITCGCKTTI